MTRFLLDTHLVLWAAMGSARLPSPVASLIADVSTRPIFSVASIWEVVIKSGLGRADFAVDAHALRRGLLAAGYEELRVEARHVLAVSGLPSLHSDPFDRVLIAQAKEEGLPFLTVDQSVLAYGAPAADARV